MEGPAPHIGGNPELLAIGLLHLQFKVGDLPLLVQQLLDLGAVFDVDIMVGDELRGVRVPFAPQQL